MRTVNEDLQRLLLPFFEQGNPVVFSTSCCGRLYVGKVAPQKCRTCAKAVIATEHTRTNLPKEEPPSRIRLLAAVVQLNTYDAEVWAEAGKYRRHVRLRWNTDPNFSQAVPQKWVQTVSAEIEEQEVIEQTPSSMF